MPSLLGLHLLGRYDPASSKPSRGWCNEVPYDDDDAEAEWEEYIRRHGSLGRTHFDNNASIASSQSFESLKIEDASEEAIEDEIERSQRDDFLDSDTAKSLTRTRGGRFLALPVRVGSAREAADAKYEDFSPEVDSDSSIDEAEVDNQIAEMKNQTSEVDNQINGADTDIAEVDEIAEVNSELAEVDEITDVDSETTEDYQTADEEPNPILLDIDEDDDFDDDSIFALTPDTCPGRLSSPRPLQQKTPLRIFVCTWNMAAEDPFAHRRRGQYIGDDLAAEELRELLPLGYDIYVIGTQEKVTKHLDAAVLARIQQESLGHSSRQMYQRLVLTAKRRWLKGRNREYECQQPRTYESSDFNSSVGLTSFCGSELACMCSPNASSAYSIASPHASFICDDATPILQPAQEPAVGCCWWNKENEEKEIRGHGDNAFIRRKSTGLAVYYANHLHGRIEVVAVGSHKFTGSKGGVAVTIQIAGDPQTLTFANCHLEAKRIGRRRRQLEKLARELPRSLGLSKDGNATLATSTDHVIWMGDFNYRIQKLDGDEVLHLLSTGRLQELHDGYDSMADDLRQIPGLKSFREPVKWPTFYPTYKKVACRSRLPLSGSTTGTGRDTRWAQHVYKTTYREPFYKGGRIRERVPGWCDRILYCSRAGGQWENCLKVEQAACSNASRGRSSFGSEAVRDNYRALNDDLRGSDHSPVTCTFLWSVQR